MDWGDFTDATSGARRRDALGHAARILARSGSRSAALDAEVLLAHSLALTREELIASAELRFDSDQAERFAALLARRVEREPVAYIVGRQEFWSLDFQVSPDVLIPRSDTERLIEVTLGLAGQLAAQRAV